MISGKTTLIAHIGYPTHSFKAPMIYNPHFEKAGIDAVVVPMGVQTADYPEFLRLVFRLSNIRGALITMPHKVTTIGLVDEITTTAAIAGAANAVLLRDDGTLLADQFDGEGFVRGALQKGVTIAGASALVVGSGGVGSAIAASLAGAGLARLAVYDVNAASAVALAGRLRQHYPALDVSSGSNDPAGHDVVVNATPLGMNPGDPLPMDMSRLDSRRVRRRGRDDPGRDAVPAGRDRRRLPHPGGHRHAVRADPGLPGVLRLRHDDRRGPAGGGEDPVLGDPFMDARPSGAHLPRAAGSPPGARPARSAFPQPRPRRGPHTGSQDPRNSP